MGPDLVVKNRRIVNSLTTVEGAIHISGGKIVGISRSVEGNPVEVIDAGDR